MNEYVYIGKIVNTHGIKGELRILSDFEKKDAVFLKDMPIYIGKEKQQEIIESYRPHKQFEMITLKNYTNINEVLKYKNKSVYVLRVDLHLKDTEYLYEDLLGLSVYENEKMLGNVVEIVYNTSNPLLYVKAEKNFYIPLNDTFIKKVDRHKRIVEVENVKGLML